MVARAWTTIILWLSTLGFSFALLMTFTTRNQRQVGVGTHELPPGPDGQTELLEYPVYEWYTEYAPDSYMLMVMSIILLLILVNVFATYFVWRGAINLPTQAETKMANRAGVSHHRRKPEAKTKRDSQDDDRFPALDDEYATNNDGEFMTLEELQRRQRG